MTAWNFIGILSTSLFVMLSPELEKTGPHQYESIFKEKIVCGSEQIDQTHQAKYCFTRMNPNAKKVVYFFPGILHNEMAWFYQRKNLALRKIWFSSQSPDVPDVVTVSVSTFFMAKQTDEASQNLLSHVLKAIEEKNDLKPTERIFYGNSLGAYNAFQMAFLSQKHDDFPVKKLILGCPLIPVQNPFDDVLSQRDYYVEHNKTNASLDFLPRMKDWTRFWLLQGFQRKQFKNSEEWQKSSPLLIAYDDDLKKFPETYIVGGDKDEFHFMDGAEKLSKILEIKKVPETFQEIPGHHCVVDTAKISEFILRN